VGRIKQVSIFIAVYLPAPLGSMNPSTSPALTKKESDLTASLSPYDFLVQML
jgi:hypothetical protein